MERKFKADSVVFTRNTAAAAVPAFLRETNFGFVFAHFQQIAGAAGYTFTALFTFICIKYRRHLFTPLSYYCL